MNLPQYWLGPRRFANMPLMQILYPSQVEVRIY
jgi:hypothetical protein